MKKHKSNDRNKSISWKVLFRYATPSDFILMTLAFLASIVRAVAHAARLIAYSELVAMLVDRNIGVGKSSTTLTLSLFGGGNILINATREENMKELRNDSWSFGIVLTIITITVFISGIIYVDLMNVVGLRILVKLRRVFFEATLRKDIGWHDMTSNQSFAVCNTDNMEKIRDGISEKLGQGAAFIMTSLSLIVMAFVYGWKLSLLVGGFIPFVLLFNYILTKVQGRLILREQDSYTCAGSLVEEIIGAIRTVVAFGGENIEAERYDELLIPARSAGRQKGVFLGISEGVGKSLQYFFSAAIFWYGITLVLDDRDKANPEYTPSVLLTVYFGLLVAGDFISRTIPYVDAFTMAMASAVPIFEVIDSTSKIDPMATDGKILNYGLKGDIEFQDVCFSYPSRHDVPVLNRLNLKISAGQTVALVGHSGCGKSTCLQLLQRFYDSDMGSITLDGLDIRKYNVSWLRSNIGVVGQEPVLFQGTVGDNIKHGNPTATQKEIEEASKVAGAYEFIIGLPQGYETLISEKGVQLSGGQRQRIAIARALVGNPKILLLDEATSALDYHSEKLVQNALNRAREGLTTIVVSHRLSAICDADTIVFIHDGKVVESGTHNDLMAQSGKYFEMVTARQDDQIEEYENDGNEKGDAIEKSCNGTNVSAPNVTTVENDLDQSALLKEQISFSKILVKLIMIARNEWRILAFGTACSVVYGSVQPMYAYLLGSAYAAMALPDQADVYSEIKVLSILSIITALVAGLSGFFQSYLFNSSGVWLATRLRSLTFRAILAQEIGWFDEKQNSAGALSSRLSGDAAGVQGSLGVPLSGIIQAMGNLIISIILGFYFSWQMAVACLCTAPFMVASVVLEARYTSGSAVLERNILEETSRIAAEAVANIRTVAGLCREPQLIKDYNQELEKYESKLKKRLRFRGVVSASGYGFLFFGYAVAQTYGGLLCAEGEVEFKYMMMVSESLLYGFMVLAISLAFFPSFTSGLVAGHRLFQILEREPKMKSPTSFDNKLLTEKSSKGVSYRDVSFQYPTRPDVQVLRGLNLNVSEGKTVALVGASGCGKSTCIQLLLRYYDPDSGKITIDGESIHRDLTLPSLRRRLGIVSQEPILFERTIADNIAYGDNFRQVTMDEIIGAAKQSNAYSFITLLPQGFDTKLGARGTQLSGGQKQRIAIARALIRNPRVLLLDEATSALDLQSEKIVQEAIDKVSVGRTCIVVAHRLSTIQNADLICVLQDGQIVEHGSHLQLLASDGVYAKLVKGQRRL